MTSHYPVGQSVSLLFETSLPPPLALAAVTITISEIKINNYSKPSTFPRVTFLENTLNTD
jgi:hypothetical protein